MILPRQQTSALAVSSWSDSVPMDDPSGAGQEPAGGMSIAQVIPILRAHWKWILIVSCSVIALTAAVVKSLPKSFDAVATLIVNTQSRDPLASRAFEPDINYVATQTELMLSPVILLPVVDRMQLAQDKDFGGGAANADPNAQREFVGRVLASRLEVTQGRGGQLLYVTASDRNPARAAEIANTVADVYLEEERRRVNGPAGERAQRYSSELAELRAKAAAAQDKVIEFQQQHGIADLTAANSGTESQALDSLEQQLLSAQSVRRSLQSQTVGQEASTTEVVNSDLIQELKTQLRTQEAKLAQARTEEGPNHPEVLQLQSQIETTKRSIAAEVQVFSATTATQLSRAKELESKLAEAVAAQRAKVLETRRMQDEGSKLLVERDSAQAVFKRALDGYDQILFAAVGHDVNVSFVSRATPPVKATKPNKMKLFVMGSFVGLLLGFAGPVGYELFYDRRLRCRDDIERGFGIPVLAVLEPIGAVAGRV